MPSRRGSRRITLEALYEREISGRPLAAILDQYRGRGGFEFISELAEGVVEHQAELDEIISRYSRDWTIDRMPVIDRILLRLGAFEILFREDIPVAVTINEAVELAKTYSTEDSGKFINGLLQHLADDR